MNPVLNPYAPGAGTPPPELAGRDNLLSSVEIALQRIRAGRHAKSVLMVGLRGVGKTVLLERMRRDAEVSGLTTLRIEAPEGSSLPEMLVHPLRIALIQLSYKERAAHWARKGLGLLAGFARAFKVQVGDLFEVNWDVQPGADNADLEHDLQVVLEAAGEAARAADTAIVLFIDELQYVEENELAALITSLHRASQLSLPVVLVGAGLPQLRAQTGRAKSYAERLFEFPIVEALSPVHAAQAILVPAKEQGVDYTQEALDEIVSITQGYPYFLQEWGKHCWNIAQSSPITLDDVKRATQAVVIVLDRDFFKVRLDRLTPAEKRYLRAMAELGPGPHRSGDVAKILNRKVTSLAPIRSGLIRKGMIWSPSHGDTAFTVPMFDQFMRRVLSRSDWME